jgi:hypothetical protein
VQIGAGSACSLSQIFAKTALLHARSALLSSAYISFGDECALKIRRIYTRALHGSRQRGIGNLLGSMYVHISGAQNIRRKYIFKSLAYRALETFTFSYTSNTYFHTREMLRLSRNILEKIRVMWISVDQLLFSGAFRDD